MADAKLVPERGMNLHPLDEETPCPSCGQPSLVYLTSRQGGDVYRCAVEHGGCQRTVKHRRITGTNSCGIVTVVKGAQIGRLAAMREAARPSGRRKGSTRIDANWGMPVHRETQADKVSSSRFPGTASIVARVRARRVRGRSQIL